MKAIRFHEYGAPTVLRYEDADQPTPAAGQVLIKVAGTSFNPVDAAIRAGFLRAAFPIALPHIPGLDVSGAVAELGPDVTGFAVGDRVFGFLPMNGAGAAAEFAVAPAEVLTLAPASIPLADAAAIPVVALTAWQAIHDHAAVRPGQRVLIVGAGGGVGRYAVQFAKLAGATVLGTAGPHSAEAARSAGADQILDYTAAEQPSEPVDVVFATAGVDEATLAALVASIRPGGVLVSVASAAAGSEDAERKVRALNMSARSDATQLAEIARLVDAGQVTARISERRPIAETATVHRRAEAGDLHGKAVLTYDS